MFSYLLPIKNIISWLQDFNKDMHQVQLEAYVCSRNPKHPADIDRLVREFETRSRLCL